MKNFLLAFVVFLVWSFFGLWLYSWLDDEPSRTLSHHSSSSEKLIQSQDAIVDDHSQLENRLSNEEAIPNDLSEFSETETQSRPDTERKITEMRAYDHLGETLFIFQKGIPVEKNRATVSVPRQALDFKYKLASYLEEHPNKEVVIHSSYSANEEFESPNYGIQRGEAVKRLLIDAGIPAERIVVKSVIKVLDFNNSPIVDNGFSFVLQPLDKSRVGKLKEQIPEARIFYPMYKGTDVQVNEDLKSLAFEVKDVFIQFPNVKLKIVGHAENAGSEEDNNRRALKYAQQIKWYIVSKGKLDGSRVLVRSGGESTAITHNNTPNIYNNNQIELIYFQ